MLLNEKLNNTVQKMLWLESVNMFKNMLNSMATTGSTKKPFDTFYGEIPRELVHSQSFKILCKS